MEKNKNSRTDLLAAGRKKLQQYQKKKDGKGRKSKGNKTDPEMVTGDSSSDSKPPPVHETDTELVELSSQAPMDTSVVTNADMATPEPSSTLDVPIEVSKVDESVSDSVPNEDVESSNLENVIPVVSPPRKVHVEGKLESRLSVGLKGVLDDDKAGDMSVIAAHVEDQVPDEDDRSSLEADNRASSIDVEEDSKREYTASGTEETSEEVDGISAFTNKDVNSVSGHPPSSDQESGIGDSGVTNADVHSLSGLLYADQEPAIGDSDDTKVDVHSTSDHELTVGDSGVTKADENSLSGLLYSGPEAVIGDSSVTYEDEHSLSGLLYADHEPPIGDSGDTNADAHPVSGLPSSDNELTIGDSGVINANEPSLSGLLYSDHEPAIGDSGDTNADEHSLSGLPSSDQDPGIVDSRVSNADEHSLSGLLYADHEPAIADSSDTNADIHPDSGVPSSDRELTVVDSGVPNADEHSLSGLLYSHHEPAIDDSGDSNADSVVDIHMKSDSDKFPEKLKEQLYINNFEKELIHMQLSEERDARQEFEHHHLQWANEKSSFTASISDLEGKNRTLSEELAKCRSELEIFTNKVEEFEMSVSFSKTELDWSSSRIQELETELSNVSSELVDSKSLVSDLQAKNETLNVNLASMTKEKEDVIMENEKLINELMECKSLLQSTEDENVSVKESLALVMEERIKLEEAKQAYVTEKDKMLSDWKKLEEVLASEREDRSKNNEANEHFIQENNKVSMELLESKKLMESLQLEIANLSENLDLVTKEKTKLGEDTNNLRLEKEECLTELTSCKTLMMNLQMEYDKSMNDMRESALKLEQLTNENVTLKTKITELEDQRGSHGKLEELTEALKEKSDCFEETFLKNVILDEVLKQYVHTVETRKGDFVILCEDMRQEVIITKTENSELTEKLFNSESRIHELQVQVDDMASFSNQLELLHRKLDASIRGISVIHSSESDNIIARVATSVDAAIEVIQDLQEKLQDSLKAHNLLSDSYKELNEKTKDLEQTNELAAYVIHKVFDNLQKIVNDSTEESEEDTRSEQLDQLEVSNYDMFIERLIVIVRERVQMETRNREYNLDLLRRIKELEEIIRKFNNPAKDLKLRELQSQVNQLTFSIIPYEIESSIFKESLRSAVEQHAVIKSETQTKETELHQSENRVSSLREKLHIAVTKGKGLIQQRDALKQNLATKDAAINELETKLKSYSEAGERMEALESELSYIRNSATALRESFLLKDSVLQRIEEILEDLDLPEHFHDRDIIEKIDWLAKTVYDGPSQTGVNVIERAHSYPGSNPVDGWNQDLEPVSDELRRNYEELQNKFYELAEQNEMLEQSLMERNNLVQRCEEVLEKTNMPLNLRSSELEDRIDWLRVAFAEANDRCALVEQSLRERNNIVQRCEEVLEKTNMPLDLQSSELEDKIDWLRVAFAEVNDGCALLEQSLMERNDVVQRCEEVLEMTNMPPDVQSLELERKIDWLRVGLSEANDRCALLQQDLEKVHRSLSGDLEESHGRLLDVESKLKSTTDERDQILARFEAQSHDLDKIIEKVGIYEIENEKLKNEMDSLQSRLHENHVVQGEIKRLHDIVKNMLQDPETEDVDIDSSMNDIECLEGLLKKLEEKYPKYPSGERSIEQVEALERKLKEVEGDLVQVKDERDKQMEKSQSLVNKVEESEVKNQELQKLLVLEEQKLEFLKRKLEEVEGDLVQVKEERNKHMEKSQSLVNEVEESVVKNQELQKLLLQEEQKLEVLKRKLEEVEVDLVQVKEERDQHMEKSQSLVNEVEELVVKNQELQKLVVQEEQKSGVVREKLNVAVRKGKSLVQQRDAMKQTINELTAEVARLTSEVKVRENTLLDNQEKMKDLFTLQEVVEGKDSEIQFLKNRLEEFEKKCQDLQVSMSNAEQDSRKSKRANELLVEELNEVQERNEDLLEEISRVLKEKELAEVAMRDSLSHLEQLSAVHQEERNSQFEELMMLKSSLKQLNPELSKIFNLVDVVLPKDLDLLYNLESLLESSDALNRTDSKEKNLHSRMFLDTKREEEQHSDNEIVDLWQFVGSHMQDLINNITLFEEKLRAHSKSLNKEAMVLSETVSVYHREMKSENLALNKHVSMLYEACKNSVYEIEKVKGQPVSNDEFEEESVSVSEEGIVNMVHRLLSLVKEFQHFQSENVEMNLKEMKDRVSSLQKELTEKDVQKDRMCVDLVNQIKRAEAVSMNNLQELESAKSEINDLKGQLEAVNVDRKALEQRVKESKEDQESVVVDLQEKVKSLTHALTAKEQEAESLLQALDEEEAQMEDLTNKITELEKLVKQKENDLETSEAARGKSLKKLSITVNKFDELHHLSETLVSEIDNLQSQLQERDSEISFLRDEITRCTSDSLQALESDKRGLDGIQEILTLLQSQDLNLDDDNNDSDQESLKRQITSIVSELKELRQVAQSKDELLHIERSKVEDLIRRREVLESSLREQESRLSVNQDDGETSEIVEVEPLIKKWQPKEKSMAPQVRSLRKVNNDQLAISIDDVDSDEKDKLEDEDDDKSHGFKSLTTSKLVPKFTRPVTNFVDGLWVSCDRALQRQPVLRLSLILYWALMHALLAAFAV